MRCPKALISMVILLPLAASTAPACSTFTLGRGDQIFVGRNLDERFPFDFLVVVNTRGVRKESVSFDELMTGKKASIVPVSWVSEYASITLNGSGAEFPEGGMNEAGLVFEEMTLTATRYPVSDDRATFFMQVWIQYLLDTCATVDEVIASARNVSIDGWGWHFMAVDATGASAVIEFLDGEPIIRTGDSLPYPLLCNTAYSDELKRLSEYEGFGGTTEVPDRTSWTPSTGGSRFLKGVVLLEGDEPAGTAPTVDFAFSMADSLTSPTSNLVQKVYDLEQRRMYFRTRLARDVRWVDLDSFDLGCDSPRMMLMAHEDLEGDVTAAFKPYTDEAGRAVLAKLFEHVFAQDPETVTSLLNEGTTLNEAMDRQIDRPKTTSCICTQ
jgi:choloylglycine hydrolase